MLYHRSLITLTLLTSLARAADEPANVVLTGDSRTTAGRLDVARARLADKNPADALPLLHNVLETNGNDLVPLGEGRSVAARTVCHALIARLPPADLARYRSRAEAQARRWLDQANGDLAPLHRLVDEAFCTKQAAVALDRLGDAAFQRGAFEEAESWWRQLAPLDPTPDHEKDLDTLTFPDPPPDLVARVRAKQLLARIFRAHPNVDLDAFRKLHPKDAGTLAGRTGPYADTLGAVAAQRERRSPPPPTDWPTFAGSATRQHLAVAPNRFLDHLGQLCRAGPTWSYDLEPRARLVGRPFLTGKPLTPLDAARRLAFHPVVVGQHAVVADARYVTAYNLHTGKVEQWYDAAKIAGGIGSTAALTGVPDLRYVVTFAEGCLFARLGSQAIRDVRPEPRKPGGLAATEVGESVLVCLGLTRTAEGTVTAASPRWLVRAIEPARKEFAVFEGAPVVHEGRVYVAATRFEGDRVVTAIHCYPAHPEDSTPPLLWRTDVCETRELPPSRPNELDATGRSRFRHHLLTLAGSRLVYCSHSGAVVAVDAQTGRRAWGLRYPKRESNDPADQPVLRDLAPPLFAEGRIYVAPADSNRLYCLDPTTGATLWDRDSMDVVHLVGVGQGRLIFTTWRNPRQGLLHPGGMRAVMAADGSDKGGWALPDDGGGLMPMGRPLLVGDLVLWPTARQPFGVFAVRQEDGLQPDNPSLLRGIPSGNLTYANGVLLVTDPLHLWAFVPPSQLPDEAQVLRPSRNVRPSKPEAQAEVVHLPRLAPRAFMETKDVSLTAGERFLPVPGADAIWTTLPNELLRRSRKSGDVEWRCPLPLTPTWARVLGRLLVVAGDAGLAAIDVANSKRAWSFAAPAENRYLGSDPLPPQPLDDFHLAGRCLFTTQGERRLLCLDAHTGNLLWQRWAPGAAFAMPAPRGRIQVVCPVGERLLVQTSARRWLLDAATGAILDTVATPLDRWPRTPQVFGESHVCLIPDPQTIQWFDVARNKLQWTYTLPGNTIRSGQPPIVLEAGNALAVVEPHNVGCRVQLLDRATGKPRPSSFPLLQIDEFSPCAWLANAETLFHAAKGQLSAWSLSTGKRLWQRPLPGEGVWHLERSGNTLLTWLERSASVRFRFRSLAGSLQWQVGPLPAASPGTVSSLDANTGDLVSRFTLEPESLPRLRFTTLSPKASLMPLAGIERTTAGVPGPCVVRDPHGLVVALGNRVKIIPTSTSTK